jgi:hypothetical protein
MGIPELIDNLCTTSKMIADINSIFQRVCAGAVAIAGNYLESLSWCFHDVLIIFWFLFH